jgi:hypothetical protein
MLPHKKENTNIYVQQVGTTFIFSGLWATIFVGNQLTLLQPKGYFYFF